MRLPPGNADAPVGTRPQAGEDAGAPGKQPLPQNHTPGNADAPVGTQPKAGEETGAPEKQPLPQNHTPGNADVPVGTRPRAGEDAGASRVRGWYSRGYLPHCDAPRVLQSVTFRLSDSLPREPLRQLEELLRSVPEQDRAATRRRIDAWLDAGMGSCVLRHPEVARFVQTSFLHFHGDRYRLHAWCVMPNHVHVLLEPIHDLAAIVQGWKSFTARWILRNRITLRLPIPEGPSVWMRDYWDRYIRDESHYLRVIDYIHQNPVKAGLCRSPTEWPWSSAAAAHGTLDVCGDTRPPAGEDAGAPRENPR